MARQSNSTENHGNFFTTELRPNTVTSQLIKVIGISLALALVTVACASTQNTGDGASEPSESTEPSGTSPFLPSFEVDNASNGRDQFFLIVDSCDDNPQATVTQGVDEVRIRVETLTLSNDNCADGITVTLDDFLGDRSLVDDATDRVLQLPTGGVDGPVMFSRFSGIGFGDDEEIVGTLHFANGCLYLAGAGRLAPVLWLNGTSWLGDDDPGVSLADGLELRPGDSVSSGGGSFDIDRLNFATDDNLEVFELARRCLLFPNDSIAVLQHPTSLVETPASSEVPGEVIASFTAPERLIEGEIGIVEMLGPNERVVALAVSTVRNEVGSDQRLIEYVFDPVPLLPGDYQVLLRLLPCGESGCDATSPADHADRAMGSSGNLRPRPFACALTLTVGSGQSHRLDPSVDEAGTCRD